MDVLDESEGFSQPLATPAIVTLIHHGVDFPAPVKHLAEGLRSLDSASHSVPSVTLNVAYDASRKLQHILDKEALIPRLGRDPTTNVLAPLAGHIIKSLAPSAFNFFEASYAHALYPCNRFNAAIRLLPGRGTVASAVCIPIPVEDEALTLPVDDESSSSPARSTGYPDGSDTSHIDDTLRAHLLEPAHRDGDIPFPLLLVATYQEIYSVMTSALLHRRVYGIYEPCVGLTFDPQKCELLVVFAWLDTQDDHECLQVHIALPPPTTSGALHECGVFDISEPNSARSFATFLHSILPSLLEVYDSAVSSLDKTRMILTTSNERLWRIDQAFDIDMPSHEAEPCSRIHKWLLDQTCASLPSVPPALYNMSDVEEVSRRNPARSTRSKRDSKPVSKASRSSSLPTISEDVVKAQILAKIDKLEDYIRTHDRFISEVRQYPSDPLDHTNAILSDRYFEAETWSHELDHASGVFEIVKPLLHTCAIDPLSLPNITSESTEIQYLDFNNGSGSDNAMLRKGTLPRGAFSALTVDHFEALVQYCSATSVENALRQMSGMDTLTMVGDEIQAMLYIYVSAICTASDECKSAPGRNGTEAQHRLGWDGIISVVEDAVAKDGSRISKHLERAIPLARNARFDADNAGEDLPWGNRNESLENASRRKKTAWNKLPNARLSNDTMKNDMQAHLKEELQTRDERWRNNLADRMTSLYTARMKRNTQDYLLDGSEGTQSGVHVLRVDFAFARCDTSVVISIPEVFPEGSFIDDVKDFDILRDAHEEVDQPAVASSGAEGSGPDGMPSFFGGAQSLCARLLEGETDASKGAAVSPPPQPEPPASETIESLRTQAHPKGTTEWFRDIILPLIFLEYKRGFLSPHQGMNQTRFYLISGVSYLAVLGILDFPIFGVATVGSKGRLLCAWGTRQQGSERIRIHVADTNCPEWDISDRVQAIRFALFLINLRTTHRDALVARFEAVRKDFLEAWEDRDSEGSPLKWTVEAQRKEAAFLNVKKHRDEHEKSDEHKEIMELKSELKKVS